LQVVQGADRKGEHTSLPKLRLFRGFEGAKWV
jgi:hypothetical protein